MRFYRLVLAIATISAVMCLAAASHAQQSAPQYGKFEEAFRLPNQTGNPFDPAVNDIDVVFRTPTGAHVRVPAFWDGALWRVRFCPERPGEYSLAVLRNGVVAKGVLAQTSFRCVPTDSPGFVTDSRRHVQQFVFDDGRPYYPFGMDVAWIGGNTPGYPVMFADMHAAHMNWARIWMTYWDGKALEWAPNKADNPPIGTFSMAAAKRWDAIFDEAAQNGVYVQMTLQHHGQYTAMVDPNWAENPYNVANGGFLAHPDDFFTNPRAIALTKAKYRYIVARWGYSTHLMAFELFNEVQNIREADSHFQDVVAWHKAMAAYIRSIDPYHHLITTSNSPPGGRLASIGLDYNQVHIYAPDVAAAFRALPPAGLDKPVFVGEWGSTINGGETPQTLHRGLWTGIMTPTAGGAQFWAWDQVAAQNWWPQFASVGGFLSAFDVPALADLSAVNPTVTAQGARSDLTFAPPLGWAPTTSTNIAVTPSGKLDGLAGVSSFLQGQSHRDMLPSPLAFHLNCARPCTFTVQFGQASASGAHPTLSLDGAAGTSADFPATGRDHPADKSISVDVPVGVHTVELGNTGSDWVTISQITVSDYAPPAAAMVREGADSAIFWIHARSGPTATLSRVALSIPDLPDGRYLVKLWNPEAGTPAGVLHAVSTGRRLTVRLGQVIGDIAGVVEK